MDSRLAHDDLSERLSRIPRADIGLRETPLQPLPRLSALLGGPSIYVKRDDLTDLALGGNKARILEYVMPDVASAGADVVITTAFAQSNLCRQTAAAARKMGLRSILVLKGKPGQAPVGNLVLDVLLGADLHFIDTEDDEIVDQYIAELMEQLSREGAKAYYVDSHGPSARFSAFAYLGCFLEIMQQSREMGFKPGAIVIASASGGTQAGLVLGARLLSPDVRILGVNPMSWSADWIRERTARIVREAEVELGCRTAPAPDDVTVLANYAGRGYGIPTESSHEAQHLFAREEVILLDPTYTAKAAGAMIDLIRKGELSPKEPVVFVHTGGAPLLFAQGLAYDSSRVVNIIPRATGRGLGNPHRS